MKRQPREWPRAGEALELLDAALGIVPSGDGLQVVADQLIEALAEGLGFLAGAGDQLIVDERVIFINTVYVRTVYVSTVTDALAKQSQNPHSSRKQRD